MKKIRRGFIGLVAVLALGSSGMASAAPCVDITATWDITCESAFIDPSSAPDFTGMVRGTLIITRQDASNCFFLGDLTVGTDPSRGLTGAMVGAALRFTTANAVVDGTLIGSDHMELIVSVSAPRPRDVVNTSLCSATRRPP